MSSIVERFGGEVPRTMEELLTLRGVARKTANVVLSNAFGVHMGVVVDTHVERLAKRFSIVGPGASVQAIERQLMALVPRERWGDVSHLLIFHGRRACKARGVCCDDHPICNKFGVACELRRAPSKGATDRKSGVKAKAKAKGRARPAKAQRSPRPRAS
jgi:endonuclease-3